MYAGEQLISPSFKQMKQKQSQTLTQEGLRQAALLSSKSWSCSYTRMMKMLSPTNKSVKAKDDVRSDVQARNLGPWSSAMELVNARAAAAAARQGRISEVAKAGMPALARQEKMLISISMISPSTFDMKPQCNRNGRLTTHSILQTAFKS